MNTIIIIIIIIIIITIIIVIIIISIIILNCHAKFRYGCHGITNCHSMCSFQEL